MISAGSSYNQNKKKNDMASIDIKVSDIGDFAEVTVIELLVKPGDSVKPEQSLITVESDKASMEIPSSHAGVVKELKVRLGDKVKTESIGRPLQQNVFRGQSRRRQCADHSSARPRRNRQVL